MSDQRLTQADFEDLSAWLDGELDGERSARVAALVGADPVWRRARAELTALGVALDAYTVPDAPADLAERILRRVAAQSRRLPVVIRLARWLAPAAAAAGIVLAARVFYPPPAAVPPSRAEAEAIVRDNFGLMKQYVEDREVVVNLETLEAIAELEAQRYGT